MNRLTHTLAALLMTGILSSAAYGAKDQGDNSIPRSVVEEDSTKQFAQNDRNGDGTITIEEWLKGADERQIAGGKRVFAKIDTNRDMRITKPELTTWQYALFDCIDANSNGTLDGGEVSDNVKRCGTDVGGFDPEEFP